MGINSNAKKTNTNSLIPQKEIKFFLSTQLSWYFMLSYENGIISNTRLDFIHSLSLYVELSAFVFSKGKRKSLMTFCKYQLIILKTISFSLSQLYPLQVYTHLPSIKTNLITKHVFFFFEMSLQYSTYFLVSRKVKKKKKKKNWLNYKIWKNKKKLWLTYTFWKARLYFCVECV